MADAIWTADEQRICNVGCGWTRRALLALEPGARVWISVEGTPLLFERAPDDAAGRSVREMRPVGESAARLPSLLAAIGVPMFEIELVERPADAGRSADQWLSREATA